MKKSIHVLAFLLILFSCENLTNTNSVEKNISEMINIDSIKKNNDCINKIKSSLLPIETIENLLLNIRDKNSLGFNRVILIFYSEEGEVIHSYHIAILIKNKKTIIKLYKNQEFITLKTVGSLKIDNLYEYFDKIESSRYVLQNRMIIIDADPISLNCFNYININFKDSEKIKNLSFLEI